MEEETAPILPSMLFHSIFPLEVIELAFIYKEPTAHSDRKFDNIPFFESDLARMDTGEFFFI